MLKKLLLIFILVSTVSHADVVRTSGSSDAGLTSPFGDDMVATGKWTFGSAEDAANTVRLGETAGSIVFEGSSASANELTLAPGNPSSDVTVTIPATLTGTLPISAQPITFAGLTAARTFTLPDASHTILTGEASQNIGGSKSFSNGAVGSYRFGTNVELVFGENGTSGAFLGLQSGQTPAALTAATGTASNSIHVAENADIVAAFNFQNGPCGTSACTDPTFIIHSANQSTTEYISLSHNQTNGVILAAQGVYAIGGAAKTLTETTPTSFARISVPSGTVAGGDVVVTIEANDATDYQARTLRTAWSAVNKAGTITATVATPEEVVAVSAGTLTCTLSGVDAGSNNLDLQLDCTSSLPQTTLRAVSQVRKNFGTGTVSVP